MDANAAMSMMSALAQPTRLKVAVALAREFPRGVGVNDLAKLVDTPQNTMSSHLAILSRAGVVVANRLGRIVEYSVHESALHELADFVSALSPKPSRVRKRA